MYLLVVVCLCARFQENLKQFHYIAAKRILKYLKVLPLWVFVISKTQVKLIGYLYADYANCKIDQNSTSESCQFI